jgi:hypothetical protein
LTKKTKKRINRRQPPGPDYQFTLDDLQRMVEQMGGRFQVQIYPRELDERHREEPPSVDAVDPSAADSGTPTTRV